MVLSARLGMVSPEGWLCARITAAALKYRARLTTSPEHRHKLVWLCWYDLMMGATLEDWLDNLKRKAPEDLGLWLVGRQEENISLTQMMDEYLLFTGH